MRGKSRCAVPARAVLAAGLVVWGLLGLADASAATPVKELPAVAFDPPAVKAAGCVCGDKCPAGGGCGADCRCNTALNWSDGRSLSNKEQAGMKQLVDEVMELNRRPAPAPVAYHYRPRPTFYPPSPTPAFFGPPVQYRFGGSCGPGGCR